MRDLAKKLERSAYTEIENIPSAYVQGFARAREVDPVVTLQYIRHTTLGDPALDPVMDELHTMPPAELHQHIRACIEQDDEALIAKAPQVLRDFFDALEVPDWADFESFKPGQRAFFNNMGNMLIAYAIGSAVEGFSTLVSKSFSITGRVPNLGPGAIRRLRQNNRHMIETYYPGGLQRGGDGWKISMRIRFIHARIRKLLAESEAWDHAAWGTPLSAAHIGGISLYTFSIRQFEHAVSMGSEISQEELDSIVRIWRYGGYLLGTPETILFTDEPEARQLYKIGHLCEPPPDEDAIGMANAVFKALPVMAGLETEAEAKSLQMFAYRLSRALIGNKLADQFGYPNTLRNRQLMLWAYRTKSRFSNLLTGGSNETEQMFEQLFEAAQYDKGGISYKMPDHVRATQQTPW